MSKSGLDRKTHEFTGTAIIEPDVMFALRNKYGVKGLAIELGINKRGLYNQYDVIGVFRQPTEVADKINTLYEEMK